ncbi:hypothetical protein HDU78_004446 [Chytriomyces hyalinus]|nr:hypothetical protein HDU78_004446 [Chytriomyces hyalinus]
MPMPIRNNPHTSSSQPSLTRSASTSSQQQHKGTPNSYPQYQAQHPAQRNRNSGLLAPSPTAVVNHERQHEMWQRYRKWLVDVQEAQSPKNTVGGGFGNNAGGFGIFAGGSVDALDVRRIPSVTPSQTTLISNSSGAKDTFFMAQQSYKKQTHYVPDSPASYLGSSSRRDSLLSENTVQNNSHMMLPSPSFDQEFPPRRRQVSFGGASMRSFDSQSPTSVAFDNDLQTAEEPRYRERSNSLPNNHLQETTSANHSRQGSRNAMSGRTCDPDLLPLPPHHAQTLAIHNAQRFDNLLLRPSNDFMTALLACKTKQAVTGKPSSPTHSNRSNQSHHSNLSNASNTSKTTAIPSFPRETQMAWESALRMRIPLQDWHQLTREMLDASMAFSPEQQLRTHQESRLYWDIVWRILPLACMRPIERGYSEESVPRDCCARCGAGNVETFVHFLWTCPVAIVLWKRLEWVVGTMAAAEVRRERSVALRKYGGGSKRNVESWYGVQGDGRIPITMVDVLFCFPKMRTLLDEETGEKRGPAERFVKTVAALHATALMSLVEARAYPNEDESIVWTFFVGRYEARREMDADPRRG